MKKINLSGRLFPVFIIFLFTAIIIYAYGTGRTGATLKTGSAGCSCHSSTPNSSVQVAIAGPSTLAAGATGNYTVSISGGSGTAVGVDIASSVGSLAPTDGNLKLSSGELVHTSKKSFSGGKYTFNFSLTAPQTNGPITLYATGCSVFSQWNFGSNFVINVTTAVDDALSLPKEFSLLQNYPNPFNPSTVIKYSVPEGNAQHVSLKIFDSAGREIETLVNETKPSGFYEVRFDASYLSAGVYFYRLTAGNKSITRKFTLLK